MLSNIDTTAGAAVVDTVTVDTLICGPIEVPEDRIITFVTPLLGFPEHEQFIIYQTKPGPLFWLQSVSDKDVAFAVLMPFQVGMDPDYDINAEDLQLLGVEDLQEVSVYSMVTLDADPQKTTTNLRAPILVGRSRAVQIVYDNDALDLRFPLSRLAQMDAPQK